MAAVRSHPAAQGRGVPTTRGGRRAIRGLLPSRIRMTSRGRASRHGWKSGSGSGRSGEAGTGTLTGTGERGRGRGAGSRHVRQSSSGAGGRRTTRRPSAAGRLRRSSTWRRTDPRSPHRSNPWTSAAARPRDIVLAPHDHRRDDTPQDSALRVRPGDRVTIVPRPRRTISPSHPAPPGGWPMRRTRLGAILT